MQYTRQELRPWKNAAYWLAQVHASYYHMPTTTTAKKKYPRDMHTGLSDEVDFSDSFSLYHGNKKITNT